MTAQKGQVAAAPEHGCCGDEAVAEPHNGASKLVDRGRPKHIVPSKIAEPSCCGVSAEDSGPAGPKRLSIASK